MISTTGISSRGIATSSSIGAPPSWLSSGGPSMKRSTSSSDISSRGKSSKGNAGSGKGAGIRMRGRSLLWKPSAKGKSSPKSGKAKG
ncbi:hypothetical protein HanRHA438_Chr16g0788751 [Helianthus annuus]|nr:hypothetical protein HanRHA438_Chr16g0788751 [Helianthus annuus]